MSFSEVLEEVESASARVGRKSSEIEVLPVSKGQSLGKIESAMSVEAFPRRLGENYFQELCDKKPQLPASIEWHYLGALQSRKIASIISTVSVVHALSRTKELERLSTLELPSEFRFYAQVNVSGETTKSGFTTDEMKMLSEKVNELALDKHCAGLMTLAAPLEEVGEKEVRRQFAELRSLRDEFFPAGGLSMGMSADFALAIEEGSTCLRIGSRIFGERKR